MLLIHVFSVFDRVVVVSQTEDADHESAANPERIRGGIFQYENSIVPCRWKLVGFV